MQLLVVFQRRLRPLAPVGGRGIAASGPGSVGTQGTALPISAALQGQGPASGGGSSEGQRQALSHVRRRGWGGDDGCGSFSGSAAVAGRDGALQAHEPSRFSADSAVGDPVGLRTQSDRRVQGAGALPCPRGSRLADPRSPAHGRAGSTGTVGAQEQEVPPGVSLPPGPRAVHRQKPLVRAWLWLGWDGGSPGSPPGSARAKCSQDPGSASAPGAGRRVCSTAQPPGPRAASTAPVP